jgi:hypothetical protein
MNAAARGRDGEIGLTQIKPSTAREVGFTGPDANLEDPVQALRYGGFYLAKQFRRFGTWPLALAAYNAGPGNVAIGNRASVFSYALPILQRANALLKAAGSAPGSWGILAGLAALLWYLKPRGA